LSFVYSQRETNIWYFGDYAGLDFNSGTPIPLTDGALSRWEGVASFSDSLGNLLFYTDGDSVWNKQHKVMANGGGLLGDPSSTESAIVVPYPQRDSLYYLFTVDNEGQENGLCYSIINMNLNGGLGNVTDEKNILLETPIPEKVTAVRHKNNEDIWLITHGWKTDSFFVYSVTQSGLNTVPQIFEIGARHDDIGLIGNNAVGYMRVSPNGQKIALGLQVSKLIEIYDFDNETGEISNTISIPDTAGGVYGIEFSPDASKLYITSLYYLYQVDLLAGTPQQIIDSYTLIGSSDVPIYFGALQLATNGKIYMCHKFSEYLGVINNPTELGIDCNFELYGQYLGGRISQMGLPNFIQTYFIPPEFTYVDYCYKDSTIFIIENTANIDSVLWNFGDSSSNLENSSELLSPKHFFSEIGDYQVILTIYRAGVAYIKERIIKINPLPDVNLGQDTTICQNDTILLDAYTENANYFWNDFSTDSILSIYNSGQYWVRLADIYTHCRNTDTLSLIVSPLPDFSLGNDTSFCLNDSLILFANYPNSSYLWSNFSTDSSIIIYNAGKYWLKIIDKITCSNSDTIIINNYDLPIVNIGNDTIICPNTTINLSIYKEGNYLWNNGSQEDILSIDTSGTYNLLFEDSLGCKNYDTINISQEYFLEFSLINDTIICEEENILLSSGLQNADFLWQNYSDDSTFFVFEAGTYWLKASNICGSSTDTVIINYKYCGEIYIPNIITPNNDGINDYLKIKGIEEDEWELEIINRWGKTIYKTDNYLNDWKADKKSDGVYYYILQNRDYNQKFSGFFHVYH